MHEGVTPPIPQQDGVSQAALHGHPRVPQDRTRSRVARVARCLNSLNERLVQCDRDQRSGNPGPQAAAPKIGMDRISDSAARRRDMKDLAAAHHTVVICNRREDPPGRVGLVPSRGCLGYESVGLFACVGTPSLEPAGALLRRPLVYTLCVCDAERAKGKSCPVRPSVPCHRIETTVSALGGPDVPASDGHAERAGVRWGRCGHMSRLEPLVAAGPGEFGFRETSEVARDAAQVTTCSTYESAEPSTSPTADPGG